MLPYTDTFTVFIPDTTFGLGAVDGLGKKVKRLGCKKPLIVTDEGVVKAGLLDRIEKSLKDEQIEFGIYSRCQPDAPFSVVNECAQYVKEGKYDVLIGIGGGSTMDITKVVSIAVTNEKAIADYVGPDKVEKPGLHKIFIPTTAGTAAEWSWAANVTDDRQKGKRVKTYVGSVFLRPDAVIVDPHMTMNLPQKITAQTGIDTLCHGIESFTSWRSSVMSDMVSGTCISLVAQNLRAAFGQGGKNTGARYNMAIAASLGFGFTISSGGIVHGMSYPLQMNSYIAHGEAIAILLPNVMEFHMLADIPKFAKIAMLMGENAADLALKEQAQKGIKAVRELISDVGLPSRMRDVDIKREDIPGFVETVFANSPHLVNNSCRIASKQDMTKIFEAAW